MQKSSLEYLSLLSFLYLRHGRVTEATTILEGLTAIAPTDSSARAMLAYAYLQNRDFENCLEQLNRMSRSKRSSSETLIRIRALHGLGRREEARSLLAQLKGRLRGTDGS